MRQNPLVAALTAAAVLTVTATALAAGAPERYRTVAESTRTDEVRVTRSGATWFRGVDSAGRPVTVVFQPRFATFLRDGKQVPVSYLRAGDGVEVTGRRTGDRFLAASAASPTAPSAAAPLARRADRAACFTAACSDACRTCCATPAATPARAATASCCAVAPSTTAASAPSRCCGPSTGAVTAKQAGCCG